MKNVLIFISGAAIGSVVTWKLVEKKYKDLADEEIASVVETFKNRKSTKKSKEEIKKVVTNILDKPVVTTVDTIVAEEGYSTDEQEETEEEDESNYTVEVDPGTEVIVPYVIMPEQFGEYNEYGTKTLTYYADDVLTDEIDNPITSGDMETMIGPDALSHFGEYEDDSVYIRDEMNEMDYEILKSDKLFSEIPRGRAN